MMNSLRYSLIGLVLLLLTSTAFAQVPTNGDCLGAIPICNTSYSYGASPAGEGNYPNEINSSSCLASGELNTAWFIFTVQSSGQLNFLITPNNSSDDYDWAVYNLTNANCSNIYSNSSLQVSCNYSQTSGTTGPNGGSGSNNQGATGSPYNATIPVSSGQTYVINVSNFSSTTSGYTINFGGSTATIFDNNPPSISSVQTPACGSTTVTFNFSENVLCSTVSASDFSFTGPGGPYTISGVSGAACSAGASNENTYTLTVSPAITASGNYALTLSGSVTDNCGNAAPPNTLNFTIASVTPPTASGTTICGPASTTLNVSGSTGTYQWYDAASGGTLLSSSSSYTTPSLSTTTTYYVQATSGICSSVRVPVTVNVNLTPSNPTAAGTTICSNNTATVSATAPGGSYEWYTASSGGSLLGSGSSYTTGVLTSSTIVYVQTTTSGCTSGRTAVNITVNTTPNAPTVSGTTICSGNSTSLTATAPGGTYEWYTASSGGSFLGSGATYTTGVLTSNATYYVQATSSGCTGPRTAVTVTVTTTPAAPTASGTSICSGTGTTLTATAPGGTYDWYTASSGGTLLGTGSSYSTGTLTGTVTYYVQSTISGCPGPRTPVTVTVNPQDNAAFSYSASSFCQTGGSQNPTITGTPGGTFSAAPAGLSINGTSGQINVSGSTNGSYTVTYTTSGSCPDTDTQPITITNSPVATFTFSGPYCTNAPDPLPTFTGGGTAGVFSSAAGLVINSSTGQIDLSASTPGVYNVQNFIAASGGCNQTQDNQSVTINPSPVANVGSSQTICSGLSATIGASSVGSNTYSWTSNPAGFTSGSSNPSVSPTVTTDYTLVETIPASGCSQSNTVTITVNTTPVAPTVANASVCSGTTATLTATAPGGTYEWYDAVTGGTLLQSGASYTTPVLTGNAVYYVQSTIGSCTGSRTAVNVTVNALPDATFTGLNPAYCISSSPAVLTPATAGGVFSGTGITGSTFDPGAAGVGGPYNIKYVITDGNGCTDSTEVQVSVNGLPDATFTGLSSAYCEDGSVVTLSPTVTGGVFSGQGVTGSTFDPSLAGPGGPYTIRYVISVTGCADSTSQQVTVNALPDATFTGLAASYCVSASAVVLSPTVAGGTFSGTGVAGTSFDPSVAGAGGPYSVQYSITDGNGCSQTNTQSVTVNALPDATFTGLNAAYCVSNPVITMSPVTVSGGAFNGPGTSGMTFDPAVAGVGGPYDVEYIVTDVNGCTDSSTIQVTVNGLPDASFIGINPGGYCVDVTSVLLGAVTTGGTFTGTAVTPAGDFNPSSAGAGTWTIQYAITDLNGCTDSSSQQIVVNPLPDATFTGLSPAYCTNALPVTLQPSVSGGNFTGAGVSGLTFDPGTAGSGGTVTYQITDANGCVGTSSQTVVVNSLPAIDRTALVVDSADCGVNSGQITGIYVTGTSPFIYHWFDAANDTIATDTIPNVTGLGTGYYSMVVVDANGCVNNCGPDTVYMRPGVTASFTCSTDSGVAPLWVTFANQTIGANSYSWTFGENAGTSTVQNPGKLFKEEGEYEIQLIGTNANGCADTALLRVFVIEEIRVQFPNVFSPNGDGINDLFHFNTSGLTEFNCRIYNRWGENVYEWQTVNSGWDGKTTAGVNAADGVYFFTMSALSKDGEKFTKEGTVTLVR